MRLKKVGIVTVGTAAALVAASPMAFATGGPDGGKGGHGPEGPGGHGHGPVTIDASQDCGFAGGDAGAASEISGDSLANAVAQAPIAGNNIANLLNCSNFLNNNLNDNLSGNQIALL